ncbi:MAG: hypothetical protein MJZ26_03515 [Fibrobacter sp.]|nr:hypothetical protein [Fibrobacter sp.]
MKFIVVFISLLMLSSCATIMNGGRKTLNFYSADDNADISVITNEGEFSGRGHVSVQVKSGTVSVVARKKGCETAHQTVESHFSGGWYIVGNLFSWVYFGWIFDPILGGMNYYEKKDFDIVLNCGNPNYSEPDDAWQRPATQKFESDVKQPAAPVDAPVTEKDYPTTYVAVLETAAGAELLDYNSRLFLTDVLRDAASRTLPARQGFVVMTRENISVMLPPGKSLEECEGSCLAETGRNIAADFVTQARIGKFASFMTITVELYETKTSKLISSITAKASNEEQLLEEIEKNAGTLFGKVIENR